MSVFSTVPLAVFGPGSLYVTRIDVANQTPVNIGYCQEFSYDESAENKELYGQNQYALVAARGTIKSTGKIKAAVLSGLALNAVFNAQTFLTGQLLMAQGENHAVPAAVTHPSSTDTPSGSTITLTSTTGVVVGTSVSGTNIAAGTYVASFVPNTSITLSAPVTGDVPNATTLTFGPTLIATNSATFDTDLGVLYANSGLPLMKVAGAPAQGQYAVSGLTGGYSFNAADAAVAGGVNLTYAYTAVSGGQTITVNNTPIGTTPVFQIDFSSTLYGNPYYARFFACISSKLTRSHKITDFVMPEVDFAFFANNAGKVYEISYPQIS